MATAGRMSGIAAASPGSTRARARPRRRLPPTAALQGRAGEPAAAGRLRPRPHRDPHQLHELGPAHRGHHPRRHRGPRQARDPEARLDRPGIVPAGPPPRRRHKGGGIPLRRDRARPAQPGRRAGPRRPRADATPVLPLRGGHRAASPAHLLQDAGHGTALPGALPGRDHAPAGGDEQRRLRGLREDPAYQRRPLPPCRCAGAGRGGDPHPARGGEARLVVDRARHLRHPLRALAGPRQTLPARRALHRPCRISSASSTRW